MEQAEAALRQLAVQRYQATGQKTLAPGVKVRDLTRLTYDPQTALAWAIEHRLALRLDVKAFEQIARVTPLACVTLHLEPQATLTPCFPGEQGDTTTIQKETDIMEHARLIVHRGAVRVTRDQLAEVPTPPATPTWKPIPHALLVSALHEECGRRGMQVVQEEYAVQRQQTMLFGVMTLNWLTHRDLRGRPGLSPCERPQRSREDVCRSARPGL